MKIDNKYANPKSLRKVIESALEISIKTTGKPVNRMQKTASDFLTKNTLVSLTIWNIGNPKPMNEFPNVGQSFSVLDFPSAFVLVRTLFESYINMNYVFNDPKSDDEREFRLNLWDRHALIERQKMASFVGSKISKLGNELQQIDEYEKLIKRSRCFLALSERDQNYFLHKKKWTRLKTIERADRAGINSNLSNLRLLRN